MYKTPCQLQRFSIVHSRGTGANATQFIVGGCKATLNQGAPEEVTATGSITITFCESAGFEGWILTSGGTETSFDIRLRFNMVDRELFQVALSRSHLMNADALEMDLETSVPVPKVTASQAVRVDRATFLSGVNIWRER